MEPTAPDEMTEPEAMAPPVCVFCSAPLVASHWMLFGKMSCEPCLTRLKAEVIEGRKRVSTLKAILFGGVAALGCGIAYGLFVHFTDILFALFTIGMGWVIAKAVQRATNGFGSRRHQVLAVVLTYGAACMGYTSGIAKALFAKPTASAPAAATGPTVDVVEPPIAPPAPPEAPAPAEVPAAAPSLAGLLLVLGAFMALLLASPFILVSQDISSLVGLAIIAFGMHTAWKNSAPLPPLDISGPHALPEA